MSRNYGGTMVADIFARFGADTEPWQKEMRSAVTRMLFAAESLTQSGRIMSTAITAPMAAIAAIAVKTSIDFDRSTTKMKTLVGVSADVVDGWHDGILQISSDTGRAATDLADAMFFITSNGLRGAAAMDVLTASAQASAVGLGEAKDVAFAATSAINAYGEGSMTGAEAVAVLVKTVREGNLEASELPQVLGQVLPVASALGVEFHEAGAAIAAMTRSGVSAKIAALGMRSILQSLLKPTTGAQKAAAALGTSFEELRKIASERGVIYALQRMEEATGGNRQALAALLPNQKAFVASLQLMGENAEAVEGIFESLAETTEDDLNTAFQDTTKSAAYLADKAKADLGNALIKLGDNLHFLVQGAASAAEVMSKLVDVFNKLPVAAKGLVTGVGAVVFAIGPLLYAMGSLARMSARGLGLGILFQWPWVQKAAEIRAFGGSMSSASIAVQQYGSSWKYIKAANIAGLLVAAATAGWTFGKSLDKLFGITDKMNKKFGDFGETSKELSKVYEKNTAMMNENAMSAAKQLQKIGEVKLAEDLLKASLAGNAAEVSKLVKMTNQLTAAYTQEAIAAREANKATQEKKTGAEQVAAAMKGIAASEDEVMEGIKEQYDLMTAPDIWNALDKLMTDREAAQKKGISDAQINSQMAEEYLKYLRLAKDENLILDEQMKSWGRELNEQGVKGFEEIEELLKRTNEHVDGTPGKFIEGAVKMGDAVATNLTRGFGQGFEGSGPHLSNFGLQVRGAMMHRTVEGFGDALNQFPPKVQEMVDKLKAEGGLKIPVTPDEQVWIKFFHDLADGKYPDTGG